MTQFILAEARDLSAMETTEMVETQATAAEATLAS
jgi:hypothetical protein